MLEFKRSFYLVQFVLNAGGGYGENRYLLSKLDNVKLVCKGLLSNAYTSLFYGLELDLRVFENGLEIQNVDVCRLSQIHLDGYKKPFIYKPKTWTFESDLNTEQYRLLEEQTSEYEDLVTPGLTVTTDWTIANVKELSTNLLRDNEKVPLNILDDLYFETEPELGSYMQSIPEFELIQRFKKELRIFE